MEVSFIKYETANIDSAEAKNIDLLPIAFNACVINRPNKNGDILEILGKLRNKNITV